MRVALVIERLDPLAGGLERWTCSLARFLIGRGHEVHVVAFATGGHDLGAATHILTPRRGIVARARQVAAALAGIEADVVHDTGTGWSGHVFHAQTGSRRLSQARLVATHPPLMRLRAAVSPAAVARGWQMAWLERRQVRRAKRIIAPSRWVAAQLAAQHRLAGERITVIHNGVEADRWAEGKLAPLRQPERRRLALGDSTVFLASAHNMHLKGVDVAMRALAALSAEGADVRLVVAGGVPTRFWTDLAGTLGVADRISFQGSVDRMEPLFAAADALVHPTRWDACSLSTIEAGAAGLPVITTAMNGAAELVADGETGFVLPDPESVTDLAGRMRSLLDPTVRRRLGSAARAASLGHDLRTNLEAVEAVLLQASA